MLHERSDIFHESDIDHTRKCKVHGHTTNQLYQDKELTAGNCRCYRVSPIIKRESYEVRLALPENGNGASVYQ